MGNKRHAPKKGRPSRKPNKKKRNKRKRDDEGEKIGSGSIDRTKKLAAARDRNIDERDNSFQDASESDVENEVEDVKDSYRLLLQTFKQEPKASRVKTASHSRKPKKVELSDQPSAEDESGVESEREPEGNGFGESEWNGCEDGGDEEEQVEENTDEEEAQVNENGEEGTNKDEAAEADQEGSDEDERAEKGEGEDEHEGEEDEEEDQETAVDGLDSDSAEEDGMAPDEFKLHLEHELAESEQVLEGQAEGRKFCVIGGADWDGLEALGSHVFCSGTAQALPLPPPPRSLSNCNIKKRLLEQWQACVAKSSKPRRRTAAASLLRRVFPSIPNQQECGVTELQRSVFALLNGYRDLVFCERTVANCDELMQVYALHVLNHALKTRDRIVRNNFKARDRSSDADADDNKSLRDQGFTRCKVLVVLPFRNSAYRFLHTLLALLPTTFKGGGVAHKARFEREFGSEDDDADQDGAAKGPPKPKEFHEVFDGNIDDCFSIGLAITRKSIKLFTDFYASDIIIASPLGLRLVTGAPGDKDRDVDFLSSVEVLVLDQSDVFLYQNWEHVSILFDSLNLLPSQPRDTDFSRVRAWALNNLSSRYRQTAIFSAYLTPEINTVANRHCLNWRGCVKVRPSYAGSIAAVIPHVRQIFQRLHCTSPADLADTLFNHFSKQVLPPILNGQQSHTLIFIPSYLDYVRVRNHLKSQEASFTSCCEYTSGKAITRARTAFFHGNRRILLITERFHFFRRYRIRGVEHVVFYSLPDNGRFYADVINMLQSSSVDGSTVLAAYTRWEVLRLERIAGTDRAQKMLSANTSVHMFF